MRRPHRPRALLLCLALLAAPAWPAVPTRAAEDPWVTVTPPLTKDTYVWAATLPDGQVYVRGGQDAERYDPRTDRWTSIATGLHPLFDPALVILPGGVVLTIGGMSCGHCGNGNLERYDPATGKVTFGAYLHHARAGHTATVLGDGRVLVTGGEQGAIPRSPAEGPYTAVELYDPATDTWTDGPPLALARAYHTATRLADGRVLVVGGVLFANLGPAAGPVAEIYDPVANSWTSVAPPIAARADHTATRLANGQVLVVGGAVANGPALASAEVYDPAANGWTAVASLPAGVVDHTATPLTDGAVLIAGGGAFLTDGSATDLLATTFRYDPATATWRDAGLLATPRAHHAAVLLADGTAFVVGHGSAERYTAIGARCFAETGRCAGGRFLAYWQAHGGLAVNGYPLSDAFTETLEDGKPYTVQYFERVRLEYHPEQADPAYQVLLGQFGRHFHPADPPAAPAPGTRYFAGTGHNLGGSFQAYWEAHGGLAQFGYPLTEEFTLTLEDGNPYTVQYFERARFEYHPDQPKPYDVLLGQFGRAICGDRCR